MNIQIQNKKISQIKADYEVVLIVNKKFAHKWVRDEKIFKESNFKGDEGETLSISNEKRLYIGIESLSHDDVRVGVSQAVRCLQKMNYKSFKIGVYTDKKSIKREYNFRAMAEGAILGGYKFDHYKSKKEKIVLKTMIISVEDYDNAKIDYKKAKVEVEKGITISRSVNFARNLVNYTPSDLNPLEFSRIAKDLARSHGLKISVKGEEYIRKNQMGAFLAVSQASKYPPQLIHLTYKNPRAKKKVCLVGKGLTFDTGGLSLKPSDGMYTMKLDMGGASAILGVVKAVSELKFNINLDVILGVCENAIGKDAYKPDDVLTTKHGKTVEVKNTDAEGGLVLADCLCYAQELEPDYIIDIATLTGACMVALGDYTSGVMSHNVELANDIIVSAKQSGELAGILPFNKHLPKLLKSEVADIANLASTRMGGAITAALFLSFFINENYRDKWAHIDIAGPAYTEKGWGVNPFGATGYGVRALVSWLEKISMQKD